MDSVHTNSTIETQVLIIGSGPTGATAALALASYGIKTLVISRWNWVANTPRAHITNQRTMEVFRELGIEQQCYKEATPWALMGDSLITTSLAGEELLRIRSWGTDPYRKSDYLTGSPCELLDIPQPLIEPILVNEAQKKGAIFRFNTEYLSHSQDANGVTVQVEDRISGEQYTIRAQFLIGADGARSKVLDDLGLSLEGHTERAGTHYTWFEADLTQYVAHRPSILYWICSPDTAFGEIGFGLLRAIRPWQEWIAGWGFDLQHGNPEYSDKEVTKRIQAMVGDPNLKIRIIDKSVWYVNQAYAPVYHKGRVFCGGDAVHRHPPSSGLGLNTCVQDAFNLAWKLAYVLKGYATNNLLETYTDERAPIGQQIVHRANQSRLDYGPLQKVFRNERAKHPVQAGIKRFKSSCSEGQKARQKAYEALNLKQHEFNAQGVELNQRYQSTAVRTEAEPETWRRDKELYLQPTTRPGAKIPHAWLINQKGARISTLDIVGKGKFTIITGRAGEKWAIAARALNLPYLRAIVIDDEYQDVYYEWYQLRETSEDGVLLVRPDGFVAWRQMHYPDDHSQTALKEKIHTALKQILS